MQVINISTDEISAICSNLAKGCEKQRLIPEMEAFNELAAFYKNRDAYEKNEGHLLDVKQMLDEDLEKRFIKAKKTAENNSDRGALRSLVWSEKVSIMIKSLLERFMNEGEAMLVNSNIYVCDICGFIYVGDTLPDVCPVCKVPNHKITKIERS